jgi:HEAT repeat protein
MRERGAWVLGDIGVKTFYQPLVPLLSDDNESVRSAAIEAAGRLHARQLVPRLISALGDARVSTKAVQTLIAYGSDVEPALIAAMAREDTGLPVRRVIPKVLGRIGKTDSATALHTLLDHHDLPLREAAIRALNYMISVLPGTRVDENRIRECVVHEVRSIYDSIATLLDLGASGPQATLITDTLQNRRRRSLKRIFRLLGLIYPGTTLEAVHRNLQSTQAAVRANAVELLDNVLDTHDKNLLLPVVEDRPAEQLLRDSEHKIVRKRPSDRLRELLDTPDSWLRVCALHLAANMQKTDLVDAVQQALSDGEPFVRETALWAFMKLSDKKAWAKVVQQLRSDPDARVKQYAAAVVVR